MASFLKRIRWVLTASPRTEATTAGILSLCLFVVGASAVPVIGQDESRFAQASREMLDRGDLVVPSFGGAPRYDKPILVYWLMMASFRVFGVSAGAARLPSNLAAAAAVALLAFSARRRWPAGSGLLAGALLATTLVFHFEARASTADLVMFLPTLAAMLAMERLYSGEAGVRDAAVFWIGIGLSILAKGPVGPMIAAATLIAIWALGRRWRSWKLVSATLLIGAGILGAGPAVMAIPAVLTAVSLSRRGGFWTPWRVRWGLPLAVTIVLPWVTAAWLATDGDFFRVAIGRHVIERGTSTLESHGGFPGFYLITTVVTTFPWFAWLLATLRDQWRSIVSSPDTRFFLAWLIGPWLVLETVQTQLVHYLMPAYPAGILLTVHWVFSSQERARKLQPLGVFLFLLVVVFLAVLPVVVACVLLTHAILPLAYATGLFMILTAVIVLRQSEARSALAWGSAGTAAYLLALLAGFLPALSGDFIAPKVAAEVERSRQPGETVVLYRAGQDELLFELPLDTRRCGQVGQMVEMLQSYQAVLGVTPEDRFSDLLGLAEAVASVRGIDLGHGRWRRFVLFRSAPVGR